MLNKNPNLEPNMKSIGWRVAELWPFEVFHTLAGERTLDIGDRMWFYILSNAAKQCIGQTKIVFSISVFFCSFCSIHYHQHTLRCVSDLRITRTAFITFPVTSTIWLEETHRSSKNHLAENNWGGLTVTEFRGSHGMEEGKGERYLALGHQYGNALLGVRRQEEEKWLWTL